MIKNKKTWIREMNLIKFVVMEFLDFMLISFLIL